MTMKRIGVVVGGGPAPGTNAVIAATVIEAVKLGASVVHGPHVFNFTDVYEALDAAGGARRADTGDALVKHLGQLLADPKVRATQLAASERVVEQLGGGLERTLAALEPYLLQLRLEMGAANA